MSQNFKYLLIALGIAFTANVGKDPIKESGAKDAAARFEAACKKNEQSESAIPLDKISNLCASTAENSLKRLGYERFTKVVNEGVDAKPDDVGILKAVVANCTREYIASR